MRVIFYFGVLIMARYIDIIFCLALLLFFIPSPSYAKPTAKPKVAVLPFSTVPSGKREIGRSISEMIMTNLGKSKEIILVERLQIANALRNFKIEMVGIIDESTAIKIGQWLGANSLVLGNYTQIGRKIRIDARIVDIRTGSLLDSAKVEGTVDRIFEITDNLATRIMYAFTKEKAFFRDRYLGKNILNKEYTISSNNHIEYENINTIAEFLNFKVWTKSDDTHNAYMRKITLCFNNNCNFVPNLSPMSIIKGKEYRTSDGFLVCKVKVLDFDIARIEYERLGTIYIENAFNWIKVKIIVDSVKE